MPMSADAIVAGKIPEDSVLVDQTAGANAVRLTNSSLPLNWKGRVLRIVATNRDNAVRLLSIYSGDAADRDRNLKKSIVLTNYETRVFEVLFPEKDDVLQWKVATATQDTDLYGLLDAVTTGVLIESLEWIPEFA